MTACVRRSFVAAPPDAVFALGCGAFVYRRVVSPILDYSFRKRHEALQAFFAAEAPASTAADPGL